MDNIHSVQELIERTQDMPLERMRFFINEDRREPKCFGIYYDGGIDGWVVYKNKADGSRAVRYSGPDEGYAANELWQKILSEIEKRRMKSLMTPEQRRKLRRDKLINGVLWAILIALVLAYAVHLWRQPDRGYYLIDDGLYYFQSSDWYYYDDGEWEYYDAPDDDSWYEGGYRGSSYDGFEDEADAFENSGYYVEPSSDSDSSVFDSWDSSDTDWDSDW